MARARCEFEGYNITEKAKVIEVIDLTDDPAEADGMEGQLSEREILNALEIEVDDEEEDEDDTCILCEATKFVTPEPQEDADIRSFRRKALRRMAKFDVPLFRSAQKEVMRVKRDNINDQWTRMEGLSPASCYFLRKLFLECTVCTRKFPDFKILVQKRMQVFEGLLLWMIHEELVELRQHNLWEKNVKKCPIACYIIDEVFKNSTT